MAIVIPSGFERTITAGRTAIVQGILDLGNLLGTPWALAAAWPDSELVLIDDAGHDGSASMTEAVVAATDRFAARR